MSSWQPDPLKPLRIFLLVLFYNLKNNYTFLFHRIECWQLCQVVLPNLKGPTYYIYVKTAYLEGLMKLLLHHEYAP